MMNSLASSVAQPKTLKTQLYQHQLTNIYRMEKLECSKQIETEKHIKNTLIGFLTDPTGTGKTASVVGLLVRDKMEWNMENLHVVTTITNEAAGLIRTNRIDRYNKINTTVILMSNTIIHQWALELSQSNLKVGIISSVKHIETLTPSDFDVLLVSTTMFNNLMTMYHKFAWKRFIFDEPGHVKVPKMKNIIAGFYWFITATPTAILSLHVKSKNSFMQDIIVSCNYYNFRETFNQMYIENDPEYIKSSFEIPTTNYIDHVCHLPLSNIVQGFVSPLIQTMIEAGNIEGSITLLGGNKTDNVVELVRRKKLEELEEIESKIRIYGIRNNPSKIEEWNIKKNRVLCQIDEIEKRFDNLLQNDCVICGSILISPVLEPNCQNLFCGKCLFEWLKRSETCPTCRINIQSSDLVYVKLNKTDNLLAHEPKVFEIPPTKLEKIIQLVKNKVDGKFIIFSAYDDSFLSICNVLRENNIKYSLIKGNMRTKEIQLDNYRTGDTQVICLNSSVNASGLNLQETTDIILYHKINDDASFKQLLGRANRIGRKTSLNVHQLKVNSI